MFELEDDRRDELVESWSRHIVDRGLATAAIFLLEAHKPLSGVGAHAVLAFQPLLTPLVSLNVGELAAFLRSTDNIELLIRRIEELNEVHVREEAERTQRRRIARRRARRIHRLRRRQSSTNNDQA